MKLSRSRQDFATGVLFLGRSRLRFAANGFIRRPEHLSSKMASNSSTLVSAATAVARSSIARALAVAWTEN
jgi:hypothetical protein